MLIKEYRIILPMTVEDYKIGQLFCVAEASKNETGGGEGVEVIVNEPFSTSKHEPKPPLLKNDPRFKEGQYTFKIYHCQSKVPGFVRIFFPKNALELEEHAWNAYPYCRTIIDNPKFMKDKAKIMIESMHIQEDVDLPNVHQLDNESLKHREVIYIDIANDSVSSSDYDVKYDPTKIKSAKTNRGPLKGPEWWKALKKKNPDTPIMCCYKLVSIEFKQWGLQGQVESFVQNQERRIFQNFHRRVFCQLDSWFGLTIEDIRAIEENTKKELDKQRATGEVRGMKAEE